LPRPVIAIATTTIIITLPECACCALKEDRRADFCMSPDQKDDHQDRRYPIGRFTPPVASSAALRARRICVLRRFPERLRAAVAGLSARRDW